MDDLQSVQQDELKRLLHRFQVQREEVQAISLGGKSPVLSAGSGGGRTDRGGREGGQDPRHGNDSRSQRDRFAEETNSLRSELKELWRETAQQRQKSPIRGITGILDRVTGSDSMPDLEQYRRQVTFLERINAADRASERDLDRNAAARRIEEYDFHRDNPNLSSSMLSPERDATSSIRQASLLEAEAQRRQARRAEEVPTVR